MNPFDETIDTIVLRCEISAYLQFELKVEDFRLLAVVKDLDLKFIEIDSFFKTSLNTEILNSRVGFLKPFALGIIGS